MPDYKEIFFNLLDQSGAVVHRSKGRHPVYRLPNGQQITVSLTPSDSRSWPNALSELRHKLGLVDSAPKHTANPARERRKKSQDTGRRAFAVDTPSTPMLDLGQQLIMAMAEGGLIRPDEELTDYKPPRKLPTMPSARHGKVRELPKDVIETANLIGQMAGEDFRDEYIRRYLAGERNFFNEGSEERNIAMSLGKILEQAQQQKTILERDLDKNVSEIKRLENDISVKRDLLKKANDFLEQLELTMVSYKEVEPMFIAKAMKSGEADNKNTKTRKATKVTRRAEGIPTVTEITRKLYEIAKTESDKAFTATDALGYLVTQQGFEKVGMREMHMALGYELKRKEPLFERVGRGMFKVRVQPTAENQEHNTPSETTSIPII